MSSWIDWFWAESNPFQSEIKKKRNNLNSSSFGAAIRRGEDAMPVPPPPEGYLSPGRAAPESLAKCPKRLKQKNEVELPEFKEEAIALKLASLRKTPNGALIRKGENPGSCYVPEDTSVRAQIHAEIHHFVKKQ